MENVIDIEVVADGAVEHGSLSGSLSGIFGRHLGRGFGRLLGGSLGGLGKDHLTVRVEGISAGGDAEIADPCGLHVAFAAPDYLVVLGDEVVAAVELHELIRFLEDVIDIEVVADGAV